MHALNKTPLDFPKFSNASSRQCLNAWCTVAARCVPSVQPLHAVARLLVSRHCCAPGWHGEGPGHITFADFAWVSDIVDDDRRLYADDGSTEAPSGAATHCRAQAGLAEDAAGGHDCIQGEPYAVTLLACRAHAHTQLIGHAVVFPFNLQLNSRAAF